MTATAFHDLHEDDFPLTIQAFREDNDECVWKQVIDGPGAIRVPALAKEQGVLVWFTFEYGDGTRITRHPTQEEREEFERNQADAG